MKYKITKVSDKHLVIEFEHFGFIEYLKDYKTICTNIFKQGLAMKDIKKIMKIFKRNLFLYKIGLFKIKIIINELTNAVNYLLKEGKHE